MTTVLAGYEQEYLRLRRQMGATLHAYEGLITNFPAQPRNRLPGSHHG